MTHYVQITINVPIDDLEVLGTVDKYTEKVEFWGGITYEDFYEVEIQDVKFKNYEIVEYDTDTLQEVYLQKIVGEN